MSLWSRLTGGNKKFTVDSPEIIRNNLAQGKAVMLDVRSQEEWNTGHLKGAVFIPITELKSLSPDATDVPNLDKSKIIYCH